MNLFRSMQRRPIRWVWAALIVWTLVLAVGTSQFAPAPGSRDKSGELDYRRGAVVFLFVGGFVGIWILLVATKRPQRRVRDSSSITDDSRTRLEAGQDEHDEQQ